MTVSLVTGASGFLGGRLAHDLSGHGDTVYVLGREGSDFRDLPPTIHGSQILRCADDPLAVVNQIAALGPDVVYHCGGKVLTEHKLDDIPALINANVLFATSVFEGLSRASDHASVVTVGTYLEYDSTGRTAPTSLYAATKQAAGEIARYYARRTKLRHIDLKPSVIYGEGEKRPRLMQTLVRAARSNEPIDLSPGEQKIDLIHVDDAASAIRACGLRCLAATEPISDQFFAISGQALSLREIASVIESLMASPLNVRWGARPYRDSDVMEPYVTGLTPPNWRPRISLQEGLSRMLAAPTDNWP